MSAQHGAPVRLLVVGAGGRGAHAYAPWCLEHPDRAAVVAAADPDPQRLSWLAEAHGIAPELCFTGWSDALAQPGPWDAVVIATPDRLHVDPALAALDLDYDILMEKPIAPTRAEVQRMADASADRGAQVTVGHVLRYTPYFQTVKRLVDDGAIGRLQTIEWAENIGYWHFAHSYVRGNWHNSADSSPMILAKACHDLDLLRWLAGSETTHVSSFGSLSHFRSGQEPEGATDRCMDGCAAAETCPFNAVRFYIEDLASVDGPPVTAITTDTSPEGRWRALRETDYGRCVYRMDNDVVDHQVVNLRFRDGVTASLLVTAFSPEVTRTFRLMGSHGHIAGDLKHSELSLVRWRDLPPQVGDEPLRASDVATRIRIGAEGPLDGDASDDATEAFRGHSGGDAGLMDAFVDRVRRRRDGEPATAARTALGESLESHLVAFAAEEARHTDTVVDMARFWDDATSGALP